MFHYTVSARVGHS